MNAAKVVGLERVVNHLEVYPSHFYEDSSIKKDVFSMLLSNLKLDSSYLDVQNGKATISGTLPTYTALKKVLEIITSTPAQA